MNKMRKIYIILFIFIIGYAVIAKEFRVFPFYQLKALKLSLQPEHDKWYDVRMRTFSNLNAVGADWLMLGDSFIEYGYWSRLFPNVKIANRGIAGDDTRGVLSRVHLISDIGAPHVMVMLGINDIYDDIDINQITENYKLIINELLATPELENIYIVSTLYVGVDDVRLTPKIKHLNRFLKEMSLSFPSVYYLDLNQILSDKNSLKRTYTSDGIHLNEQAYQVWACELFKQGVIELSEAPQYCKKGL